LERQQNSFFSSFTQIFTFVGWPIRRIKQTFSLQTNGFLYDFQNLSDLTSTFSCFKHQRFFKTFIVDGQPKFKLLVKTKTICERTLFTKLYPLNRLEICSTDKLLLREIRHSIEETLNFPNQFIFENEIYRTKHIGLPSGLMHEIIFGFQWWISNENSFPCHMLTCAPHTVNSKIQSMFYILMLHIFFNKNIFCRDLIFPPRKRDFWCGISGY
jgi:hypothetical protein